MKITYLGHSGFHLLIQDTNIVLDPFITQMGGYSGAIDAAKQKADFVIASHGHFDHVGDVEEIVKLNKATFISNWEIASYFEKLGIEGSVKLNTGGRVPLPCGGVRLTKAEHSSSLPDGTYGGNAHGLMFDSEGRNFYFAGDTDLFGDMKLFGELDKPEFAFLPIGGTFTMDINSALIAANFLNVKKVIAMHFDTFPGIAINHAEVIDKAKSAGVELILPKIGEMIEL